MREYGGVGEEERGGRKRKKKRKNVLRHASRQRKVKQEQGSKLWSRFTSSIYSRSTFASMEILISLTEQLDDGVSYDDCTI